MTRMLDESPDIRRSCARKKRELCMQEAGLEDSDDSAEVQECHKAFETIVYKKTGMVSSAEYRIDVT